MATETKTLFELDTLNSYIVRDVLNNIKCGNDSRLREYNQDANSIWRLFDANGSTQPPNLVNFIVENENNFHYSPINR